MQTVKGKIKLNGETGKLAKSISEGWLLGFKERNPAILAMFKERDKLPYRELVPWAGEFAGKYITGAYFIYKLTNDDERLKDYILSFIDELQACVDDGYVGTYQKKCRLTGAASSNPEKTGETWDAWNHCHIMRGLYLWYQETGDSRLLGTVKEIAELFMRTFYDGKMRLADIGSTEMNLAPIHIFALLYLETREQKYLDFALCVAEDLALPNCGDYINNALAGIPFYKSVKPRWEALHIIMGVAALYRCTNDEKYLTAVRQIYDTILEYDVHNSGGFSTDEQAIGTPFKNKAIELCCTIAFNAFAFEIYALTPDPAIIDHLETAHYNAVLGSFSPTGRWSTYNTPMEGEKISNCQAIVFQARSGSPELNCCSAYSARGVGQLAEWAFSEEKDTLYVNYYEACSFRGQDGLEIEITGEYPVSPEVKLSVSAPGHSRIALHIPAWSKNTVVYFGPNTLHPPANSYLVLEETRADIRIVFDFTPHFIEGGDDYAGKKSIFIGPLMFGCDLTLNDFIENPTVSLAALNAAKPVIDPEGRILLKLDGITLCDFYRLGLDGSSYKTWFIITE